ncbi:hypothetical protein D3C73_1495740 [compost metagenome]
MLAIVLLTLIPALFTKILTGPKAFSVSVITLSQSAALDTSCFTNLTFSPNSLASAPPVSSFKSVNTTFAPSATNLRTWDSPIPRAPPVTIATLPVSLPISI